MIRAPRICIYGRLEYKFPYILRINHLFVFLFIRATTENWASIWPLPAASDIGTAARRANKGHCWGGWRWFNLWPLLLLNWLWALGPECFIFVLHKGWNLFGFNLFIGKWILLLYKKENLRGICDRNHPVWGWKQENGLAERFVGPKLKWVELVVFRRFRICWACF